MKCPNCNRPLIKVRKAGKHRGIKYECQNSSCHYRHKLRKYAKGTFGGIKYKIVIEERDVWAQA